MNVPRSIPHASTLAAAGILLAMFLFGGLRYSNFATPSTLTSLMNDYAFVGIAAIGATLVILSGGIDLSAGAVIACTSILIASLVARGVHPLAAWAIALLAGAFFGAAMGFLIHTFALPAFLVTLAGMFAARATGFLIHPQSQAITHPVYTTMRTANLPLGFSAELSPGTLIFFAALLAAWFLATRTPLGRGIYALGGNERSARVMGLPIARNRITTYTLAGLCSALGGCVFTMYKESGDPASAVGLELDIFAAVVIGGTLLSGGIGSLWGTLIGILILGLIRLIIDNEGNLSAAWTSVATGLLLLLFVGLQRLAARDRPFT